MSGVGHGAVLMTDHFICRSVHRFFILLKNGGGSGL